LVKSFPWKPTGHAGRLPGAIVVLARLASKALTQNQILILRILLSESFPSATSFVEEISKRFEIPKSTVWFSLRKLRKLQLIEYGNPEIYLTPQGEIITRLILYAEKAAFQKEG